MNAIRIRLASVTSQLTEGTHFGWRDAADGGIKLTCPWGNSFELRLATAGQSRDQRGEQPGTRSAPSGMPELRIHVDADVDLGGIARFYEELVGAHVQRQGAGSDQAVAVACGPMQQLVFCRRPHGLTSTASDYHVSMYVDDFQAIFRFACQNPAFLIVCKDCSSGWRILEVGFNAGGTGAGGWTRWA